MEIPLRLRPGNESNVRRALLQPEEANSSSALSPAGYFRADHLDSVFGRTITPPDVYAPDVIYAMKGSIVSPPAWIFLTPVAPCVWELTLQSISLLA